MGWAQNAWLWLPHKERDLAQNIQPCRKAISSHAYSTWCGYALPFLQGCNPLCDQLPLPPSALVSKGWEVPSPACLQWFYMYMYWNAPGATWKNLVAFKADSVGAACEQLEQFLCPTACCSTVPREGRTEGWLQGGTWAALSVQIRPRSLGFVPPVAFLTVSPA